MEMLEEAVQIVDRGLTQRPRRSGNTEREPNGLPLWGTRNGSSGFRVPRSAFRVRTALRIVAQYADFCNVGGVLKSERGSANAESRADPAASSPPTSAFRAPRSDFE